MVRIISLHTKLSNIFENYFQLHLKRKIVSNKANCRNVLFERVKQTEKYIFVLHHDALVDLG